MKRKNSLDLDFLLERAWEGEILDPQILILVISELKNFFISSVSNTIVINSPCTVVGDVHGQFYDVLEIFKISGRPPFTNFCFLGDYVDRGSFSVETVTLLILLCLRYPKNVFLVNTNFRPFQLRGNHECRQITQVYGFYAEIQKKFNGEVLVWRHFMELFDCLPLTAIVNQKYFLIHGGLSPSLQRIDNIKFIDRFQEIPHEGPLTDFVWSDPDPSVNGFGLSNRGAGYLFGQDVCKKFLYLNGLYHICRAHQLCNTGWALSFPDKTVSTIFSAPNYCYRFENPASICEISDYIDAGNEFGDRIYHVYEPVPQNERKNPAETSMAPLFPMTREILSVLKEREIFEMNLTREKERVKENDPFLAYFV